VSTDQLTALAARVAQARAAYYAGSSIMEDDAYDALEGLLRQSWPDCPLLKEVGAPPQNSLGTISHPIRMGSLDNAFTAEEIEAFVARVVKADPRIRNFIVQPKCDGLSVNVSYRQGLLTVAATRGDGIQGENVTANLMRARYVPRSLPVPANIEVRGEVVIFRTDFSRHFFGDANPRNSAAGTCRRQDGHKAEFLRFIAFDAAPAPGSPDLLGLSETENAAMDALEGAGFHPVTYTVRRAEELVPAWQEALKRRDELPHDVDGIVIKVNRKSRAERLGWADTCPRGALAGKWRGAMTAVSEVTRFEHSVGRTGIVTPVALITPTTCGGVTISRISLMNWDEIERLERASGNILGAGSRVQIERSGDVIPRITRIISSSDERVAWPSDCPSCGTELFRDGPRVVCQNPICPQQTCRQILHWIKERNILHLGKAHLASLMEEGLVQTVADLYRLDPNRTSEILGAAMAGKILKEIEKSRTCTVAQAVGCTGIQGIGITEMTRICNHLRLETIEEVIDLPGSKRERGLRGMTGLGEIKSGHLLHGIATNHNLLCDLAKLLTVTGTALSSADAGDKPTFCITGATELARHELIRLLTEKGWQWHSSVVNGLTYLISAEADSGSKKTKDAQRKGIQVITETKALQLAGVDT